MIDDEAGSQYKRVSWARSSAVETRVLSISNIVINIIIAGVEEALNVVKMMRLAVAVSIIIAGNSLTQRSI